MTRPLIREKVSRIAFEAELQIVAVLPRGHPGPAGERAPWTGGRRLPPLRQPRRSAVQGRQGQALDTRHGDTASGGPRPARQAQRPGRPRSGLPVAPARGRGRDAPWFERSGARALLPSAKGVRGGALVGDTTAGKPRPIRFPDDLLRRHHLYVARTRMGKSTLMHHVVVHKMREKAEGRDGDAIVVVDPHADLVAGLMEHVPESLIDRVRLIDLADYTEGAGHQPAGHPHLLRPRPHRRLGGAGRERPVGAVGAEDAVHPRADGQDPARGQRAPLNRRGQPAHHPRRAEAPVR